MAQNVISNPMTPKQIIDTIKVGKNRRGDVQQLISSYSVWLPAGVSTNFTLVVPTDRVLLFYDKHTITSEFYDEFITVLGIADYNADIMGFNSIPINGLKELSITHFNSFEIEFTWYFANLTLTDTFVSVFVELISMEVSFFDKWYRVLIQNSENQLNEIVVSLGQQSRI